MTRLRRIWQFLLGLFMILAGLLLILDPEDGVIIVAWLLSFSLVLYGIRSLLYYLRMARHMVGGKSMLYIGMLAMDLGMFMMTQGNSPRIYVILYLVGFHGFSGVIDILRALEAKRFESPSWRMSMIRGAVNVALALLSLVFIRSVNVPVYLFCAGLIYSGAMRIASAFRRTAIVYIP